MKKPALTTVAPAQAPIVTTDAQLAEVAGGDGDHCTTGSALHQAGCEIGYHGKKLFDAAAEMVEDILR